MTTITITEPTKIEDVKLTSTLAARAFIRKQCGDVGQSVFKIGIKKTGCSGFAYTFDVVEKSAETDHIFPQEEGVIICVEPDALNVFKGSVVLDYVKHGLNKRLELLNPNEKHRCGCGESVQF
jgi:iron-sulfur cluster assembly protein